MQLMGQRGRVLSSAGEGQESKQRTNLFTCARMTLYNTLDFEKKHFLDYSDRKQQTQCLLIKTTHAVVYMYSLLHVFITQRNTQDDFISTLKLKWGGNWGLGPRSPFLESATALQYYTTQ